MVITKKICESCALEKDISCFTERKKYSDGYEPDCHLCHLKHRRDYYHENLEESRKYTNEKRSARVDWIQNIKSNIPCKDCGQTFEPYCMDYDHILERGKKIDSVSRLVLNCTPKNIILVEIEKCDLVCILCHNKRTYERFNKFGKSEEEKYKPNVWRNIKVIRNFKEKPCAICGNQYEHFNMQTDHINPENKFYDTCRLKRCKLQTLLDELEKCQVLCALCHRRKSILEQKEGKYLATKISPPPELERKKLFYDSETNMKECGKCHQIKHSLYFTKDNDTKSKLSTYCIECFNEYRRKRRAQNKIQSDINK